jgi:hypothetical protein
MKKLLRQAIALFILLAAITGAAYAQERGTQADAKKMVQEALVHIKEVGLTKAFEDFGAPGGKWHYKDVSVFCYKMDGTCVCNGDHPALVGKNLIDFKYPDGQTHIKKMAEIAAHGGGWDEYPWPSPQSKKVESKQTFIAKIPGYDGFIGAGIYK